MKKNLLKLSMLAIALFATQTMNAQRYLTEVFTDVSVTPNVTYGNNITIFPTGTPTAQDLKMDIYQPVGDAAPVRPLIVYLHTGSFVPAVFNQNPTGGKSDSAAVEMCTQFAKRGYVVASATYRQGWVPTDPDQDVRTGTLLMAVYRAIQDAKVCVRYFYEDAMTAGNTFDVDTNNIILAGQGTGGYIAMAYATLDKPSEIQLSKFLSNTTNAAYGFQIGQPYVNQAALGDFDAYGGIPQLNNPNNHVGYSSRVSFVVNMGGALGDSSWLEAGDAPMVGFHVTNDPFAPYGDGPVYVPTTPPQFVVDVSGSQTVITKSNLLGNNACFNLAGFTDPYTLAANAINGGEDGLFPFQRPTPPFAPGEAGPWEWYDSTALTVYAQAVGLSASAGTQAYVNGLGTNPDMSKAKALAYIDTIQNYVNPRIVYCLGLPDGISESLLNKVVSVYPNPASTQFTVSADGTNLNLKSVELSDITGRLIWKKDNLTGSNSTFSRGNLSNGIYIVRISTDKGTVSKRISLQ